MRLQLETLQAVSAECWALGQRLHALSLRTYPSPALKEFLDNDLIPVNDKFQGLFDSEIEALKRNDGSHQPDRVAEAVRLLADLTNICNMIAGADIKAHPLEIMLFFKDVVKAADNNPVEFLTSAIQEMNFSIQEVWLPFQSELTTFFGAGVSTNTTRFVHFTFPELHKDDTLLAPVYAHELGHYLDGSHQLWEPILLQALGHPALAPMVAHVHDLQGQQITGSSSQRHLASLLAEPLKNWIREIIADTVGVYLMGPAFCFAAARVSSHLQGPFYPQLANIWSVTHPPEAFRSECRMTLLRNAGYLDACSSPIRDELAAMNAGWKTAQQYYVPRLLQTKYARLVLNQAVYHALIQALEGVIPAIRASVDKALPPGVRLTSDELRVSVPNLVAERIGWLIPPNELDGLPVSAPTIMNAAWVAYLTELPTMRNRVKSYEAADRHFELVEVLNGLIRHALYVSRIHRRWPEVERAISGQT